jgi:hypothetical protein
VKYQGNKFIIIECKSFEDPLKFKIIDTKSKVVSEPVVVEVKYTCLTESKGSSNGVTTTSTSSSNSGFSSLNNKKNNDNKAFDPVTGV